MDATAITRNPTIPQGGGNALPVQEAFAKTVNDAEKAGFAPFGDDGFSFLDVLDIINPLQHIPIISSIYRDVTGDELSPASRIAGGALFGGPIGIVASLVNAVIEDSTGKDLGGHVIAMMEDVPPEKTPPEKIPPEKIPEALRPDNGPPSVPADSEAPEEDPVVAWAKSTLHGSMIAAATGLSGEDPVTAWAKHETRTRILEADAGRNGQNPVTAWARTETQARLADKGTPRPNKGPVTARAEGETDRLAQIAAQGRIGGQVVADGVVLAILHAAHQGTDAGTAARHQSDDLARFGRDDRAAEITVAELAGRQAGWFDDASDGAPAGSDDEAGDEVTASSEKWAD